MFWFYSFVGLLCLFFKDAHAQCTFAIDGYSMDISSVKGKIYNYVNTTFNYTYSPCDNAVSCTLQNGSQYYVLSSQYKETNAYCTAILARNIDNVKYSFNAEKKEWTLYYANGQSSTGTGACKARNLTVTWVCGSGETRAIKAGEPKNCIYYFTLSSSLACGSSSSSSSSSSSLSGGWIFIIILLVVFVVYCIAGYAYNGYKSQNWGNIKENTPNMGFWTNLPKWTLAGCCVTKEFIVGLYEKVANKSGSSSSSSTTTTTTDK